MRPAKRRRSTQDIGRAAEILAAHLLQEHGMRLLVRNFRTRWGEIDLIARDGDTLVFIEVRKRSHIGYGGAAASITRRKQKRIIAAARVYLRRDAAASCRFDAILMSERNDVIEWVRDAFSE